MKNRKVTIGNVTLKNNVLLAPMAGLTDMAFRFVCKKSGAGLTETEMVSCKALFYDNEKTKELLKFSSIEKPKAVQIFGHEPEIFESVLSSGVLKDFDIIDINMGCPAPKIFNNGDGCALMKNAKLACEIIKTAKKCTKQPVMVKFRAGVDEKSVNAIEFAKMCEKAGADAITIHARTREQFYSGHADWNLIKMVKESVKIPVFANGDIKSRADAIACLEETNADGIMIGRGALGNPQIFSEILGSKPKYSKLEALLTMLKIMQKKYSEHYAICQMRAHLVHFLKNENNGAKAKIELLKIESTTKLKDAIIDFFSN